MKSIAAIFCLIWFSTQSVVYATDTDALINDLGFDITDDNEDEKINDYDKPSIGSLINLLEDDQVIIFWLPMSASLSISNGNSKHKKSRHWSDFGHSVVATNKHVMSLYIDKTDNEKVFFKETLTEISKLDYFYAKGSLRFVVLKHQDTTNINYRIEVLFNLAKENKLEYLDPSKVGKRVTLNRVLGKTMEKVSANSGVLILASPFVCLAAIPLGPLAAFGMASGCALTGLAIPGIEDQIGSFTPDLPGQNCATAVRDVLQLYNGLCTDYCTPLQQLEMHRKSNQLVLVEDDLPKINSNFELKEVLKAASESVKSEVNRDGWHKENEVIQFSETKLGEIVDSLPHDSSRKNRPTYRPRPYRFKRR